MISLCLPSRGRPRSLAAMWHSALTYADRPEFVQLVARVDHDDPHPITHDLLGRWLGGDIGDVTILRRDRALLSACWNDAAEASDGTILMHAADDIRFRTEGWDTLVRDAFDEVPDRIVFVHGRDGFQDARLGTHGFVHRRWIDAVGYLCPPLFASDYNDLWLTEVADKLKRRVYLPDLMTEHLHPVAGKGVWDLTHRERLERHAAEDCDRVWRDSEGLRLQDVAKLRDAMLSGLVA